METTRIRVERNRFWMDRARSYRILIDGEERDRVKNGETVAVDVAPGPHVVRAKIDWAYSPELSVDVPPGGEAHLHCRPRGNLLTVMYYATIGRKRYLRLEPA
jgi:hypothetical protein